MFCSFLSLKRDVDEGGLWSKADMNSQKKRLLQWVWGENVAVPRIIISCGQVIVW